MENIMSLVERLYGDLHIYIIPKISLAKSTTIQQGVCHTVALPFTLKSILRQKKNYGNSNISPCKNIIFKKSSQRNQILQDIITL
jgi:hypothetical protein